MSRPCYTARVTMIETFRSFIYNQTEKNESYNTEANLIDTIKGIYVAGEKADFGTCGHSIIENPKGNRKWLEDLQQWGYDFNNGYRFTTTQVMPVLNYYQEHPYMIREVPLAKLYRLNQFNLLLTGTADALEGNWLRDNKFKFSSFDVTDYTDSMQHRLYMDMSGMKMFAYDFFRVSKFSKKADCLKAVIGEVETMPVYAYDGMEEYILTILNEFADFVLFRGLENYLKIDNEKARKIIAGDPKLIDLIK